MARPRFALAPLALAALLLWPATARSDGLPVPTDTTSGGIVSPDGRTRFYAIPAGRETVVMQVDQASGRILRRRLYPGKLVVPGVALDGSPGGFAADGRTLVLIEPRRGFPRERTLLAAFDPHTLKLTRRIELRGDFSFDSISPDGSTLFLVQYLNRRDPTEYAVRTYELDRGRLLPDPIVTSETATIEMRGFPTARAASSDGRWVYTLYDGAQGPPFVHVLDTIERKPLCILLPQLGKIGTLRLEHALSLSPDEGTLTVQPVNSAPGSRAPAAEIDTSSFEVSDPRDPESGGDALPLIMTAALMLLGGVLIARGWRRRRGKAAGPLAPAPSVNGHPRLDSARDADLQRHPADRAKAPR